MQYNEICHTGFGTKAKRILAMKELYNYVDICLIDEYADKDFENGYSLDIYDLSENERENFLRQLMLHDTTVRDLVAFEMQKLINKRLSLCKENDFIETQYKRRAIC